MNLISFEMISWNPISRCGLFGRQWENQWHDQRISCTVPWCWFGFDMIFWGFTTTPFKITDVFPWNSQSAESTDSGSAQNTVSCKADALMESESPISKKASDQSSEQLQQQQQIPAEMASDVSRGGPPPNHQTKTQEKVWIYAKISTLLFLRKPGKSDLLLSLHGYHWHCNQFVVWIQSFLSLPFQLQWTQCRAEPFVYDS